MIVLPPTRSEPLTRPSWGRRLMDTRTATVLMSGGIDSTACAYLLATQGLSVHGLFIDYGQPAAKSEARAAGSLADAIGVPFTRYTLSGGPPVPTGELLGRNAFLIFVALLSTRGRSGLIAIGIHAGTPYYDCSHSFLDSTAQLVAAHTDGTVAVVAPFLRWRKADVVDYFRSVGLPMHLTYSCQVGSQSSCGTCASCRDRGALGC